MSLSKGLMERLGNGEAVVCASGIASEMERRGAVWMDTSPELLVRALTYQDHVRQIYEDFVHCGSDVVVAPSMNAIDRDRQSAHRLLTIARGAGVSTKTLLAASVQPFLGPGMEKDTENSFEESIKVQTEIALEAGADFITGIDFTELRQAKLALEYIRRYGKGLPIVMTLSGTCHKATSDGVPLPEALRALEAAGSDVVGLGGGADPTSVIAALREARKTCTGHMAALPDAYRTLAADSDDDYVLCTRKDVQEFSQQAQSLGIQFIGLSHGATPSQIREVAETYSKHTPASKNSPDLSLICKYIVSPTPTQAKRRLHQVTQEYRKFIEASS